MSRKSIDCTEHFEEVMRAMNSHGLLLGGYDADGKANLMTIGWGTLGWVWGMPLWIVLVRPSRHTYQCIEHGGCFTVNVPDKSLAEACAFCGSMSGRDVDKFAECKLSAERAGTVPAPTVAECPIVYECRVVHGNDILPGRLADEVTSSYYQQGDFHRVYFGKILAASAAPNAAELLRG